MRIQSVITAQNCSIEMPLGHEVGYLQNLTIQANYDLQPVKNLYQHTIQDYTQGVAQYTVSAQRAFVEMDSFFGDQRAVNQLLDSIEGLLSKENEGTSSADAFNQTLNKIGTVLKTGEMILDKITDKKAKNVVDTVKELFLGDTNIGDLFTQFEFDIRVSNPIVQYPEGLADQTSRLADIFTANRSDLFLLRGCKVGSRNISISPDNVAVMEGIEIFAKTLEDSVLRGSPVT